MADGTRQDTLDGALQLLIDDVTAKYADLLRHKPGQRDVEEDVLKLLPIRDFEFQRNELVRGWTRRLKNRISPLLESHLRDDARDTSANIALSLKNSAEYALLCEEIGAEVQTAVERLQGKSWLWTPGHSGASLDESGPLASVPDGHASSSSSDDESSHSRAANANAISSPMEWMDTSTVCSQSCVTTVSFSSLPSLDRVPPLLDQVVNGNADEETRVASLEGLRVFTATEVVANSQWSRILGVLQEDRHPNLQQNLVAYLASLFDSAVPDVQAADILLAYEQHLQTVEAAPAGRHMRLLLYMLHRIPQVWPSISESVADHLVETTLSLASKTDALLAFAKLDPSAAWLERWMLVGCTRWALLRSVRLKQFIETVYATAGPDVPLYNICLMCHLGRFKMARRLIPSTALGRLMNLVADIWAEDARATKNALYPFIVRVLTAPVVPGTTTDIHKAARMLREHALDGRRCATGVLALKVMDALSNNSHTAYLVTEGDFVCCLIERIHHSAHSIPFTAAAVDLLLALCQRRRVVNSWRESPIASAIARSLDTEALRPVAESALLALASSSAGCSIIIDHGDLFAEPFRRLLSGASTSRLHRPELCKLTLSSAEYGYLNGGRESLQVIPHKPCYRRREVSGCSGIVGL
ncbi:hypothetical protein PBRA_003798 [Plasmodiophora brassicae]|uniref:Uncharacterized protein n=1 Tax=Plasmodiophora brassicae TaxID=37360 RepID=A0A0G4IIP3_PLABS|nr:hypothetical protein PBRA_003798 [Plasmodiophora brassicae]